MRAGPRGQFSQPRPTFGPRTRAALRATNRMPRAQRGSSPVPGSAPHWQHPAPPRAAPPLRFGQQQRITRAQQQRQASYRRFAAGLLAHEGRVVLQHPTWRRRGLIRENGQYYNTHLRMHYVGTTPYTHVVVDRPQHDLLSGFARGAGHALGHAGGTLYRGLGLPQLGLGAHELVHGELFPWNKVPARERRQYQRASGRSLRAQRGIAEFAAPAIVKPFEGKPVGAWDVVNTALAAGAGPLRGVGAGVEGIRATLAAAKAAEVVGNSRRAEMLYQTARAAAREGGPAAWQAYRTNVGVIRPALERFPKLTPTRRALERNPAVQERYAKIDADLAEGKITRFQAADRKKAIREFLINPAKVAGLRPTALAERLVPSEPGLAPELHPQSLYQHAPPTLSGAEEMPARLRVKGLPARAYNLVKRGAEYRDWYRRGATVIQDFGDRLGLTQKQAAGIVAITSQGSNPTYNLRRAAEMVRAARAGERIPDMSGQYDKVAQIVHDPEGFDWQGFHRGDYGPKVSNYFANFYRHLDPQDYAKIFGADARHATIDRHMIAMLLGKKGTISDKQYDSLRDVIFRTADVLGWSPEEVQAAAWVPWKAQQMGVTQQVKAFLREADAAGTLPEELQIPARLRGKKLTPETKKLHAARSAWAREQLSGVPPAGWERHLPTAADAYETGQARYRAPSPEHLGRGDFLYQKGEQGAAADHTFSSDVAQIHSEIRPDEQFWPERAAAFDRMPPEQQIQYAKLTDQAIGHEFEDALGLKVAGKRAGQGIWRGRYAPGVAHHVFVGDEVTAGTEAELNALSAAKGMAKHQTSVSWGRPLKAGEGEFSGVHWQPGPDQDPARLSVAMDTVVGPGNVGFIHAPDGGFYVIDFNGRLGSRASVTQAIENLGGEQTAIGWDGGYTIDNRIAGEDDWGHRYQAAVEALPSEQRSALQLAMTRVRARTDQIDEHFLGRQGARIVDLEEARALAAQGTHVFHGTGGINAEQIMAERRLRIGGSAPEAAWTTTDPESAAFYSEGGGAFGGEHNIVAIPRDQLPFGVANEPHPFGHIGSPEDILFQGAEPGRFDHLSLDELHARHDEINGRYERMLDELAKGEGRPGDYKRLTAYQNATAKKYMRRTGRRAPTVKEMLRQRAETRLQDVLDANPEHPHVQAHNAEQAEALALRREIYRRNDALFQQPDEITKGAYERNLPGGKGRITETEHADVGTVQHEIAHHIRPYLTPEMEQVAREAAGLQPGDPWTKDAEEHFADSWLSFLHEGKDVPRNWAGLLKTMTPDMRRAYKVSDLPRNSDAQRAMFKKLGGHENSSAIGQMLLRNTSAASRLAANPDFAPRGPTRSREEAEAHLADANTAAEAEGFGTKDVDITHMKPGEQTAPTGGPEGERVRAVMAGRVLDKDSMGPFERVGAEQQVRSARGARRETEAARSSERARRIAARNDAFNAAGGGLKGYYAAKSELRGIYPRIDLGQTPGLNEDAVDTLVNLIEHHPALEGKSFTKTRAQDALLKVIKGENLQRNEQGLLERIFGRELRPQTLRDFARNLGWRGWTRELINLPRSFMATLDQSAMFRHGIMTLAHSPKVWARQFGPMYKALFSATYADSWKRALQEYRSYALAEKGGVQFTSMGTDPLKREEQYMSVMAEQIPGIGKIVKASDRSYVGVLNAMRMGMFDKLAQQAAEQGWDLHDEHLLSSIGKFVNSASGRGDLGVLQKHAITLQSLLFSPRLLASRINFMSPFYYASLHPFARRQAWKALSRLIGGAVTIAAFARMGGLNVVTDPRSADFMKLKHGNTRIDFLGGFQQPIVLAATLLSGTRISSTTGLPEHLSGGGFHTSRFDVLWRFFQNKLAPVPGGFVEAMQGQDPMTHEPLGWKQLGLPSLHPNRWEQNFWVSHTFPLLVQDIASLHGPEHALDPLPALGIGVESYGPPPKGEHYRNKLVSDSQKAGLGSPPASVVRDAEWQGELDNKITSGMSSYDKMKAAAEVFDQKYKTDLAPKLTKSITTEGAADKVYQELRPKIAPAFDRWRALTTKVLNAKDAQKPTPAAEPRKQGGGIVRSVEHGVGSVLHDIGGLVGAAPAAAATNPANRNLANSGLPSELASAIDRAARRYNVPAHTLAGIWRIESGSTFPNAAVNSSGYGGLFGTTKWNAPTAEQADYAASTLRHLLDQHGGSMAAALHAYSGGGYTSVPGAGGAVHAGRALGASQFAPKATGGPGGTGDSVDAALMQMERQLASGRYDPSDFLSNTLHSLGEQPLQGNVQGINFQLPKGGKAAGAARGAIALAEHFLGTPYAWGGESPGGFDCSGLLQYVWGRMGVRIPRTSQEQWRAGRKVGRGQLKPGDAVFFEPTRSGPGHVGMYIGGGRFIEAPHTGATVRISNLRGYPGYLGARRFR